MKIAELTSHQIIVMLKAPYLIGFKPGALRAELKRRNRQAFELDKINRG
jgi:hypothetical protein